MIVYETIYKPWINNTEGKPWRYIGSDLYDRDDYYGLVSSIEWKSFWKKEVIENPHNFEKRTLVSCLGNSRKDLLELEEQIQKEYNVVNSNIFFNKAYATKGCFGDTNNHRHGKKHSDETKEKMSKSWKTRKPISEETRKRMSESAKLRSPNRLGKKLNDESKAKLKASIKAWHANNEHPKGMLGKKHSEETKIRIAKTTKETKNKI
jgi:hypothetical protein